MRSPFTGGEATLLHEEKELEFRKDVFTISQLYYQCNDTKEEFTTDEIDQINLNQLYNQYRSKYGIPFPDEIRETRARYGLSAAKMSEILGFGVNSYRQYEAGDIPTVASGRLIQAAKDPEEFKKFLDASKATLSEREYHRFSERVEKLISDNRANAWDNMFIEQIFHRSTPSEFTGFKKPSLDRLAMMLAYFSVRVPELWKTKLNKLLFYADFLHYRRTGYSISGASYRAIPFGPVPAEYDKLYVKLKDDELITIDFVEFDNGNYGETVTSKQKFQEDGFVASELSCLKDVADAFASCNTSKIVRISHNENGWKENEATHGLISYQKYAFDLVAIQ